MEAVVSSSLLLRSTGIALWSKLPLETRLGCTPSWQTVEAACPYELVITYVVGYVKADTEQFYFRLLFILAQEQQWYKC
jgi:hypothetical protein